MDNNELRVTGLFYMKMNENETKEEAEKRFLKTIYDAELDCLNCSLQFETEIKTEKPAEPQNSISLIHQKYFGKSLYEVDLSDIDEIIVDNDFKGDNKMLLKDAVLFAYEQGLFTVEDSYNFGCYGIHCECHGTFPNGFYCFGNDADIFEGTSEEYVAFVGKENICKSIAETIQAFIEDESFPEEAGGYLYDMKMLCKKKGRMEYLDVIQEWIDKAEKVIEEELKSV